MKERENLRKNFEEIELLVGDKVYVVLPPRGKVCKMKTVKRDKKIETKAN